MEIGRVSPPVLGVMCNSYLSRALSGCVQKIGIILEVTSSELKLISATFAGAEKNHDIILVSNSIVGSKQYNSSSNHGGYKINKQVHSAK